MTRTSCEWPGSDPLMARYHAHMQAVGMVNDHLVHCFRYRQVQGR